MWADGKICNGQEKKKEKKKKKKKEKRRRFVVPRPRCDPDATGSHLVKINNNDTVLAKVWVCSFLQYKLWGVLARVWYAAFYNINYMVLARVWVCSFLSVWWPKLHVYLINCNMYCIPMLNCMM